MRRICKKRTPLKFQLTGMSYSKRPNKKCEIKYRIALVAKTCPSLPTIIRMRLEMTIHRSTKVAILN